MSKQNTAGILEQLFGTDSIDKSLFFPDYKTIREDKVQSVVDAVREVLKEFPPLDLEKQGRAPEDLLKKLKPTGIFGLIVDETYGGLGLSVSEYLRVIEELGTDDLAMVLIPLAHLSIGIKGIILYGTDEQKKKYLTQAASGERIFGYALTEPKHGSDAQHIETHADYDKEKGQYRLNGTKTYITNAGYAGGFTVFAQLDPENPGKKMAAFIVEADSAGVTIGKDMDKMGLKISSTATVSFKDTPVPEKNMLGEPGDGFKIAMSILNYGRLGLGAASAGLLQVSADQMFEQASRREQFGTKILSFPLIREKIGNARKNAFTSRNITYYTAWLLAQNPHMNAAMESSHVKLFGTNRCWDSLYDALQTAGGSGYLKTRPYEKRMRDFRVTTIFEGTTEIHTMYPPLVAAKNLAQQMKGKGSIGKLLFLLSYRLGRKLPASCPHKGSPLLNLAWKKARRCEARYKKLLSKGMILYGKNLAEKQFLLRKLTNLSVQLYALLAATAAGEGVSPNRHGYNSLSVALGSLITETDKVLKESTRIEDSPQEKSVENLVQEMEKNKKG